LRSRLVSTVVDATKALLSLIPPSVPRPSARYYAAT
jgi:hypothetical protein